MRIFQAFHAWLPSIRPFGTKSAVDLVTHQAALSERKPFPAITALAALIRQRPPAYLYGLLRGPRLLERVETG